MKTKMLLWMLVLLLTALFGHQAQAFYNPSTGRWLSRDPLGELGSILLRDPACFTSSGVDPVLGIDLRAIERDAMQTAWTHEEMQPYAFNQNDGINFVDSLGLMRIQDLLAKLEARKKANANKSCCCNLPIGPLPAKLSGVSSGTTVTGYYDKQFATDFFNSICILQPEIYWWDCYSASEEGGWSWNWGDYGWSGPGSTSYSKTATPDAWSMRDPYHLAMASLYVWDACENGKRVTKWKAAGGIQWTWDKKTKQWTGPDPVKQSET